MIAACATGRAAGMPDLVTYDMGGTSTDVALIRGGVAPVSSEIEVDYAMPIHVPMVDVRTVGAGGGSIARADAGGMLRVGPESAGSDPGPVCYGRGGTRVTISDANLILGRLPASRFGQAAEAARAAMADQIAAPLGLTVEDAAAAVIRLADTRELAIPRVLIPARPGVTNALGCVVADLRHDFVRTVAQPLAACDMDAVHAILAEQEAAGRALNAAETVTDASVRVEISADMQFAGQTHLIRVALPDPRPTRAALQAAFEAAYFARFRVELPEVRAMLVNLNVSVIGERPPPDLARLIDPAGRRTTLAEAQTATRPVWFDGWHTTPVYWRDHLPPKAVIEGPAVIELMDTTILIPPGAAARQDAGGNLIVEVGP